LFLRPLKPTSDHRGFTLIELVITIVVTGIIAGVLFPVIYYGAESYREQALRRELVARARLVLERMAREIRESVPNSIRITTTTTADDTIEFGRAVHFSRFTAVSGGSSPYTLHDNTGMTIPNTPFVVIYNVDPADFYAYPASPSTFPVTAVTANSVSFTAGAKPSSPSKRYQMCTGPVCYARTAGNEIRRYSGYNPGQNHAVSAASQDLLAQDVATLRFRYTPGTLSNSALVTILLTLQAGGETMAFHQEVHIRNVP